ncbi:hypothetical protein QJQ45_002241 [Haematococcus lacustris]|nr:hypothetical protein QJQ45_002241 [Haematococcus lacustris]
MATVAHEERNADGPVISATKTWQAKVKPQLTALSRVSSKPSSLASYRRFADTVLETYDAMWAEVSKARWANARFLLYCGKKRVVASFWAKVKKQAQKRWPDRIMALAYGAAGFNGSGTIGCRGVPVSQMQKEAVKQFRPGRVVLVDEFRTSRVGSADNTPSKTLLDTPPESFRWLQPVKSMAKRSQVRGLMCSTSINNITRFYDRDVSAALNIRRYAVGPGPRPTELCYWTNRPAMPNRGQPGQEWVEIPDKALLLNGQQPCEEQLDHEQPTKPAGWKPPAGQVHHQLLRPTWSQQRDQPVRGLMWCPVVTPRKPPQAPCSNQEATQPAASEAGPSTPCQPRCSKHTEAKQAAEPTQPTKGKGKA